MRPDIRGYRCVNGRKATCSRLTDVVTQCRLRQTSSPALFRWGGFQRSTKVSSEFGHSDRILVPPSLQRIGIYRGIAKRFDHPLPCTSPVAYDDGFILGFSGFDDLRMAAHRPGKRAREVVRENDRSTETYAPLAARLRLAI